MRIQRPLAALALFLLPLAACSKSTDGTAPGGSTGDMYVVSCSLGCTNGLGGDQVFCSIVNTFQNQELSILFSEEIELFSVNTSSFRVINVANGTSPSGQFFLDPLNPRRLIFRPSLSFNENGNPIFGFEEDTTYQITLPGTEQGDNPPYVQSTSGRRNRSRMQCTINTSEGIIDPVPGAPNVNLRVTRVTSYDVNGNPNGFAEDVLVTKDPELFDVYRSTKIEFTFTDIMNVATLLNPSTGKSPFILVQIDNDGTLATDDREDVEGTFTFAVDQERLETILTFGAFGPFPSAGQFSPASPRRIAVTIPTGVQDLVSNPVLPGNGGGLIGMVPEEAQFEETSLPDGGEDFVDSSNEDIFRSGANWGGGRLAPGRTGGPGELGDLLVTGGNAVVLNTDMQDFPLTTLDGVPINHNANIMGNPDPTVAGDPGEVDDALDFPVAKTITDGGFSFALAEVAPAGSLRFEGTNSARLYSRGESTVFAGGQISLVGATPAPHDSKNTVFTVAEIPILINAAGGQPGGHGADRFDMNGNTGMLLLGEPESDALDLLAAGAVPNGRAGTGYKGTSKGAGPGGFRNPNRYPTTNTETLPANNNGHGVTFNVVTNSFGNADSQCRALIVGAPGGGGAYATDGGQGIAASEEPVADFPVNEPNTPINTPGGDSTEIGLAPPDENNTNYIARKLQWTVGNLVGGTGGGGGSNHPYGSWATGYDGTNTNDCINDVLLSRFRAWHDHSGAQGGYGGGALHWVSGKKISLDGIVDLRGGNGGAPRTEQTFPDFGSYAMPGGGGSGGSLKLKAPVVEIADVAGRIDLRGGSGGSGFANGAIGGSGGTGLLRIEDEAGLVDRALIADDVVPFDAGDDSLGWISVDPGFLSTTPRFRPDSMSGSSSCWMRPDGNFFGLGFIDDEEDEDTGDPTKMGWNMMVIWDDGGGEQLIPYRGFNTEFMNSFENTFQGNTLGSDLDPGDMASPVCVRFQGARYVGDPANLCDLDLNDPNLGIVKDSISPWVDHPALLNTFSPAPNIVRFCVVFDGTIDNANNDVPGLDLLNVKGVTDLWIRVLPD
ncbi:MAG: hypothetical protein O2816_12120 [Planctomycetota bacterium]|nr:hypothetical protein [Planctomycetota bacterium]